MPDSAPVATLISSLSHIVPMMLVLTSVASPARVNVVAIRVARSVMRPSSSPMNVSFPSVPAITWPGPSSTPPA